MQYTKIPNDILEAMQSMSDIESRLTAVLVRETFGWHRKECRLTWEDMVKKTGMSRGSLSKAMVAVVNRGFFLRGWKSSWSVNSSINELSTVQEIDESSDIELLESSKNELPDSSKNELFPVDESSNIELPSLYKEKKTKEKKTKENNNGRLVVEKPPHPVFAIPENLKTVEFETAWFEWFKHRAEINKYLTQTSGDKTLRDLSALGSERATAAIMHSIGRGWANIYEPAEVVANGTNSSFKTRDEIIAEAVASVGGW